MKFVIQKSIDEKKIHLKELIIKLLEGKLFRLDLLYSLFVEVKQEIQKTRKLTS